MEGPPRRGTHCVVVGAGSGSCRGVVLRVVQVIVVEQLLGVHADGRAHVQAQLPLEELALACQALFGIYFP